MRDFRAAEYFYNNRENARDLLSSTIRGLAGAEVASMHTDISTRTGERVIIFTLAENLERRLLGAPTSEKDK